jgi:predicted RNase H-like HicB family nuclease
LTKSEFKLNVLIEQNEKGVFTASLEEYPGYHIEAGDLDELNRRLSDLMQFLDIEDKAKYVWTDASLGFITFG